MNSTKPIPLLLFIIGLALTLTTPKMTKAADFTPESLSEFEGDDGFDLGGDIFSDFNDDIESAQVAEDERFYRYGRFFSFITSMGHTTYTGNRGRAYDDRFPSFGISLLYFLNFRAAFGIGVEYSQHDFVVDGPTVAYNGDENGVGLIEVNMLRTFFSFRYYVDTSNLGTAITYSNPYFMLRFEHWNHSSKFIDRGDNIPSRTDGAIGSALGGGFDFPLTLKESYIGAEVLYHNVNFKDTFTQDYRPDPDSDSSYQGYNDLSGGVWTVFMSYVISW